MLATEQGRNAIAVEVLEGLRPRTDGAERCPTHIRVRSEFPRRAGGTRFAMAARLLIPTVALLSVVERSSARSGAARTSIGPSVPEPSSDVAVRGPGAVQAQMATDAPGQSSGWHRHTGMHALVVVSGTLTIIDGRCDRRTFSPGESYVGGRAATWRSTRLLPSR